MNYELITATSVLEHWSKTIALAEHILQRALLVRHLSALRRLRLLSIASSVLQAMGRAHAEQLVELQLPPGPPVALLRSCALMTIVVRRITGPHVL